MENEISLKKYIDFKVYSITPIKKKYGYRIKLLYEDNTSRVMQKSGFNTKKEANDDRNITITELHNGNYVVLKNIDVKTFFTYWLEQIMKLKITADSYDAYKNIVYNHIIPMLGSIKMVNLNRGDIQKFYNQKAEFSHSVAKLCKSVMNTGLKYALDNKIVNMNVAKDINLPKSVKKNNYKTLIIDSKKTLTISQVKVLIENSKNTPIYLQILFATLMGLRISEINGVKYSDIDYVHRVLRVRRQLGRKANVNKEDIKLGEFTKQEINVKTFSSIREIEIPDLVFEAILEERKKYEKNRSRRINDKTTPFKDYDYICCSTYGNPRSKSFHFEHWKKLLKDSDLPNIRFHDLRATYCTILIRNNFNLKAISKQMGHATEIISVDVYGDNKQIIADCLDELEPFINSVLPTDNKKCIINDYNTEEYDELISSMNDYIENLI